MQSPVFRPVRGPIEFPSLFVVLIVPPHHDQNQFVQYF